MREDPTGIRRHSLGKLLHPYPSCKNMGKPGAAVSVFQQWAERWVGIQVGRAVGLEKDVRLGIWAKKSRFGWGRYHIAGWFTPRLHMLQVIQSRRMRGGGQFMCKFAGLSSLPVNESGGFTCKYCLDQPSPWYKCCPEESTIVGLPPRPGVSLLYQTAASGVSKFGQMNLALT